MVIQYPLRAMSIQPLGLPARAGPSASEWETHKPEIIQLYRIHPMEHLRDVMSSKYGFYASKRMYQKRFKDWKVSKNLNKAMKDQIIESGAWADETSYSRADHITITAKDHAKVVRYLKAQSRNSSAASGLRPGRARPNPRALTKFTTMRSDSAINSDKSIARSTLSSEGSVAAQDVCNPFVEAAGSLALPLHSLDPGANPRVSPGAENLGQLLSSSSLVVEEDSSGSSSPEHCQHPQRGSRYKVPVPRPCVSQDSKSLNMEKMLKNIYLYVENGCKTQPPLSASWAASKRLSPENAFWSELKHGIYLQKVGSHDLAFPALQRAGELAEQTLTNSTSFDLRFLKEMFSSLSPINTRRLPAFRTILLQFLSWLAYTRLEPCHPVAIICHELQHDGQDREVSEKALSCMLNAVHTFVGQSDPSGMVFDLEASMIALLRRDGELELAASKAKSWYRKGLTQLSGFPVSAQSQEAARALRQTRMAATELAHVRMDQRGNHYAEAIELSLFVLGGSRLALDTCGEWPPNPSVLSSVSIIKDRKSMYALEDLAKIYHEFGVQGQAVQWLEHAGALACEILDVPADQAAIAHIQEKLDAWRLTLTVNVERIFADLEEWVVPNGRAGLTDLCDENHLY